MKDCILLPYTFSKISDYETVIVTAQKEEFTYLTHLPNIKVQIVPPADTLEQWSEYVFNYIKENYSSIDILFCFGSYQANIRGVPLYKELRPNGKVILKLDINSRWADNLSLNNPDLRKMYENCDLITCESKKMKKLLSEKWPYKIEYVVNGFLEDVMVSGAVSYQEKENVILTVGKIGTEQKANHILVDAFVKCADKYPTWKLKLIGSIEPDFLPYINEIYQKNPKLRDRILLTGKISDKSALNEEYKRAKIFALSSIFEGGTPNVFIEAARNGCYMVSSRIDAVDEITNWERCGKSFSIGDTEGLTAIFNEILSDDYDKLFKDSFFRIQEYCRRYYDYKKIVRKLEYLLEQEEEIQDCIAEGVYNNAT
jgi:Glycosyltransferase